MILLDTNVISELIRPLINPLVAAFLDRQSRSDIFLPSIAFAEVQFGIERLPDGRRRRSLEAGLRTFLDDGFGGRTVAFDLACAEQYAMVRAMRERAGRPVSAQDALIGATALAHNAILATRNIADFDGYGLTLVDPWQPA